ncbi:MAG: energy transducer TonB, partial [Segetibacter sp.]|nr:energy transducer TonB [Segetibacter sp.]
SVTFFAGAQSNKKSTPQYDTVFTKPQVFATFPGGDVGWKAYVKKNLKYPRKAKLQGLETEIAVKVVIDKDGKVLSAQHMNTAGYGFEREAVRLVTESGKWNPAKHYGRAVACEGVVQVEFKVMK